jgi:hypothetical protein
MSRVSLPLAVLVLLASWRGAAPLRAAAPPRSGLDVARWVYLLDDDRWPVRQAAEGRLLRAGKRAIGPLAAASGSLEVTVRSLRILRALLASEDRSTADQALAVLEKLSASTDEQKASRARSILLARTREIVVQLEKGGASVTWRDHKIVTVNLNSVSRLAPLLPLLRQLPDLEQVFANNRQMDDSALASLKNLPRLERLDLFMSSVGDEGLKLLASFPRLREVPMGKTKVTDAGLKHLAKLTQLEYVGLRGNQVTDAGLVHLKKLTNLTGLFLGETKVTDAGLIHLEEMKKMDHLFLYDVPVTDAGLKHLEGMKRLRHLYLWGTQVSPAGLDRLREKLPGLEVSTKDPFR